MTNKDANAVQEIQRYLTKAKGHREEIIRASNAEDLRDAWEEFLGDFGRTLNKLISAALNNPDSRPWGHKLKNVSSHGDEGLVYLREARNTLEHGLSAFAELREPSVDILGLVRSSGGETIISNSIVGDRHIAMAYAKIENGRVKQSVGFRPLDIRQNPAEIRLVPIYSQEKKRTFIVPRSLGGRKISPNNPTQLANFALEEIVGLISEFKENINF